MVCYNEYYPKLLAVPNDVKTATGVCNTAYVTAKALADGKLTTAKNTADSDSSTVQTAVTACNSEPDAEASLKCHSDQVSLYIGYVFLLYSFHVE